MSGITHSKSDDKGGTVDWESFFENKDSGVIVLIEQAKSMAGLKKCINLVIDMLHMYDEDTSHKDALKSQLNVLFSSIPSTSSSSIEKIKGSIVHLLREIKKDRIKQSQSEQHNLRAAQQEKEAAEKSEESTGLDGKPPRPEQVSAFQDERDDEDPEFQTFEQAFVYFLDKFIRVKLTCFVQPEITAPKPFILTEEFVDVFVKKSVELLAPTMLKNRRLQATAQGFSDADFIESKFFHEFEKPEKQNTTHLLWRGGMIDFQQGLSIPADTTSAADKAKEKSGGLFGKLKGMGKKPTPAATKKPDPRQEQRRRAHEFWSALQDDAKSNGYDAPLEADFPLFVAVFEYEEEVIAKQQRIASQILVQETEKGGEGRAGATRDFLTRVIDELPPYCGELIGLWAYRGYTKQFGPEIIRSFLSGMATSDEKRSRLLPLFTRWVPTLSELPEETK
jgi:hypothetical protein